MTDSPTCLHCAIVNLIGERHPAGLDKDGCNEVLLAIARIAGDILGHTDPAAMIGFFTVVDLHRRKPQSVNVGPKAMH